MHPRKPAAERQAEIVEATVKLAAATGPDRLSLDAVAAAVGISQPGIFRHFPTKKRLWLAVAAWIAERLTGAWESAETEAAPMGRLRKMVQGQLKLIRSTPAIPAILFSRTLHSENEALRQAFETLIGAFHQRLTRQISAAQADGSIRADADPAQLASLVMSVVQGTVLRWTVTRQRFDLVSEGMALLDLVLEGFRCDAPAGR
ncbi:MAG: TetR family transcriptional regulator [Alphaproteobacteria bacterium]|nr:MAG: TetR family transcriptional regulator [Alphaproteobacteria bacterium]